MNKGLRLIKRAVALSLVLLLSIESFAAVVSDNDGSAFITKGEFDSLKNSFQSQIDQYNTSIDSKIDGAIAGYLAGIKLEKTTTEQFFDGEGRAVIIVDSSTIDNLKRGKPELQYDGLNSMMSNQSGTGTAVGLSTASFLHLKRTAENSSGFEVFAVNEDAKLEKKFLFYSDDYKFKIVASAQGNYFYGYTPWHSEPGDFELRWHGQAKGSSNGGKCQLVNERTGTQSEGYYSRYLSHRRFWSCSLVGVLHSIPEWSSAAGSVYQASTESTEINNKITLIMDRATSSTQLWSHMKTDHPETTWVYADKELVNYENTADMEKMYPSDANVEDAGSFVNFISNTETKDYVSGRSAGVAQPLVWVDRGCYSATTTPEGSCLPWQEPGILLDTLNPKNIFIDDIPKNIMNTFDKFGWKGRLTEGLPIALFEKDCKVKFKLNTTTLENDSVFAIATSPTYFQNLSSTQLLKNAPLPSEISDLKIDGTNITTGAATLTAGEHTIEFAVTKLSENVPVFFKIEFPNTNTSKLRKSLILPTEYELTTE